MAVMFQLPPEMERGLRDKGEKIDVEAREAFLVALYRRGRVSHVELSQALGLDRTETEEVLHRHNVTEDLGTIDDYLSDASALEKLRATRP